MQGSIRLADIRLVTNDAPISTAVVEERNNAQPQSFTLDQN
jgi:hypothetical protein